MNVCCCCGYVSQSSVPRIFISNPMGQITMKVCQDVRSLALARQNEPATSRGNRGKFSSLQKYQAKQNNDSPLREERLDSPKQKKSTAIDLETGDGAGRLVTARNSPPPFQRPTSGILAYTIGGLPSQLVTAIHLIESSQNTTHTHTHTLLTVTSWRTLPLTTTPCIHTTTATTPCLN